MTAEPRAHKVIRFLPEVPRTERPGEVGRPGAPTRVALGVALTLDGLPPPRFAAVEMLWISGDHDDTPAPDSVFSAVSVAPATETAGRTAWAIGREGGIVVEVEQAIVRGGDALEARWADGGERYKMMSFGRRNPALSRAEFVERWRAEAGRLGRDRIPDELRGLAYVQDHPLGDDPPLDAINEVWFDDLAGLRRRAEWFAARPVPADLMSPPDCWSLYLREVVVA